MRAGSGKAWTQCPGHLQRITHPALQLTRKAAKLTRQHKTKREDRVQHRVFHSIFRSCGYFSSSFVLARNPEPLLPQPRQSTRHGTMDLPQNGYHDWLHPGASCPHLENHPSPGKAVRLTPRPLTASHMRIYGTLGNRPGFDRNRAERSICSLKIS